MISSHRQKNVTKKVKSEYLELTKDLIRVDSVTEFLIRYDESESGKPKPWEPLLEGDKVRNRKTGVVSKIVAMTTDKRRICLENGDFVGRYDLDLI